MKKFKTKKSKTIYLICLVSIFAGMAIVLEKFVSIKIGLGLKITLYALPLLVVSIVHGPFIGFLTGLVSGLVTQLTSEYGVNITSIFWALAPIAWGFVSGAVFKLLNKLPNVYKYIISIFIAGLTATFLNTMAMFLSIILLRDSGYTTAVIYADIPLRIGSMLVSMIPYIVICYFTCGRIKKYLGIEDNSEKKEDNNN